MHYMLSQKQSRTMDEDLDLLELEGALLTPGPISTWC